MQILTLEHFAGCLNQTFSAHISDMSVPFVLVDARPMPTRQTNAFRAPFSLLFRNSASVLFPQQIYPMRHPQLGEIGIFMVPIAHDREGFLYEAVFN